jgi:hypothetical protein
LYRVFLGVFLFSFGIFFFVGFFKLKKSPSLKNLLEERIQPEKNYQNTIVLLFFVFLINWTGLVVLSSDRYLALRSRLLPFFIWLFCVCVLTTLWLIHRKINFRLQAIKEHKKTLLPGLSVWLFLLIVWSIFRLTGFGWEPDNFGWGRRMVPLLSWQVGFVWVLVSTAIFICRNNQIKESLRRFLNKRVCGLPVKDCIVILSLWIFAMCLWYVQIPGVQGYPPESVSNPDRDSALYEVSIQSLLLGDGFYGHKLVSRPFYMFGLAIIHLFSGNSYANIAFFQTMVIAFLPGVLYLIGKTLGNRYIGLALGIFAIFREFNSILSTHFSIVSNSRMIMSDVPATLGICLATLFCIIWLIKAGNSHYWSILTGGILACTILVRMQTLVLIPVIIILSLLVFSLQKRIRFWINDIALFLSAVLVILIPWMVRNYYCVGTFVLDEPYTQTKMIAERYTEKERIKDFSSLPGESDADFSKRLTESTLDFIKSHPQKVIEFTASHFVRNLNDTFLVLPYELSVTDFRDNAVISRAFWHPFIPEFGLLRNLLIGLDLLFFSLGLVFAIQRFGIAGTVPLVFNLAYNFSNAVSRNSGYRYMLPVDWISYLYYGIGMVACIHVLLCITGLINRGITFEHYNKSQMFELPTQKTTNRLFSASTMLAAFCLIGLSLPLSEVLIPQKYPPMAKEVIVNEVISKYGETLPVEEVDRLRSFVDSPNSVAVRGLLMLPKFLPSNGNHSSLPAVTPIDDPRYVFMLIADKPVGVALIQEDNSIKFPDFSENAVIIGCDRGSLIDAKYILLENEELPIYRSEDYAESSCQK